MVLLILDRTGRPGIPRRWFFFAGNPAPGTVGATTLTGSDDWRRRAAMRMPSTSHARLVRATVVASAWFLVLTMLNVIAGGSLRGTIFYAVPVAFAAWHDLRLGFVFAAVGALSAWAGGSIPQPGVEEPVWIEGLWAFLKLSAAAAATRIAFQQFGKRPST